MARQGEGGEIGAEEVFFLSVEIDTEILGIVHGAELCFALFWHEAVVVVGNISQGIKAPMLVGTPRKKGLIVEIFRAIFSLGVEGAQEIARRFVSHGRHEAHVLISPPHIGAGSEEGGRGCGFEFFGTLIGDVKNGGHAVAISGLKTTGREGDALDHIGIDDGETLLLARTHKHGTIDLYTVDVDAVFIEGTAAHVVLRREFVVGGNTGLRGNDFLHGIACC